MRRAPLKRQMLALSAVMVWLSPMLRVARAEPPAQVAPAPPAAPSDAQALEDARRHFQQGTALYNDQNFNAAVAEFLAAYQAKPSSAVLYNIGLTQKALFRYNDAIESLERYLAEEPKLSPERRGEVKQLVVEMRALLADVSLTVLPLGANISVDGRTIGTSPMKAYGLAAGSHVIDVTAEGYKPGRREVLITAGVPLSIAVSLEKIPKGGRLHVQVQQLGATVKVDSKEIGPAPVDLEVGLGGHTLEVWSSGYETHREEVLVAPGQDRFVQVSLKRPPEKVYKKAAFWVPVTLGVAAVALGVGLGVGLGVAEDPLKGTLNPGIGKVN
jgi:hypothetical protein